MATFSGAVFLYLDTCQALIDFWAARATLHGVHACFDKLRACPGESRYLHLDFEFDSDIEFELQLEVQLIVELYFLYFPSEWFPTSSSQVAT